MAAREHLYLLFVYAIMLYQGSIICICRTFLKSMPSDPARESKTTFTFSPLVLFAR